MAKMMKKTSMMKSNAFMVDSVQTSAPAQTTPGVAQLGIANTVVQKTGNDMMSGTHKGKYFSK